DSHSRRPVVFAMLTRFDSSLAPSEPSTFFAAVSPHGHPARISVIDMTIEMSQVDHASDPAQLIEAYYEAGWTDGLPVVPPSDASVAAMLAASKRRADEIVGEIHGRNAVVTAESLAINAVMAGCRPEYAPVLVAAVKSLCHPDFAYHGPASSTGGSAMVLIVSGPVAAELGINSGHNAF